MIHLGDERVKRAKGLKKRMKSCRGSDRRETSVCDYVPSMYSYLKRKSCLGLVFMSDFQREDEGGVLREEVRMQGTRMRSRACHLV